MTGNEQAGRIIAAVGAVLMIVGVFLPWAAGLSDNESGWKLLEKTDVVIVAIAAVILIVIATTLVAGVRIPLSSIAAGAAFAGGLAAVFPIEAGTENLKAGIWVTIVGAAAALIGALVAEVAQGARPAAAGPATTPAPAGPTPGVAARPAPGRPVGPPPPPAPAEQRAPAPPQKPAAPQAPAAPPPQPAPAPRAEPAPAAGWYPDPRGEARLRYWDGRGWTDQTTN